MRKKQHLVPLICSDETINSNNSSCMKYFSRLSKVSLLSQRESGDAAVRESRAGNVGTRCSNWHDQTQQQAVRSWHGYLRVTHCKFQKTICKIIFEIYFWKQLFEKAAFWHPIQPHFVTSASSLAINHLVYLSPNICCRFRPCHFSCAPVVVHSVPCDPPPACTPDPHYPLIPTVYVPAQGPWLFFCRAPWS